jgi:hypothetical protein
MVFSCSNYIANLVNTGLRTSRHLVSRSSASLCVSSSSNSESSSGTRIVPFFLASSIFFLTPLLTKALFSSASFSRSYGPLGLEEIGFAGTGRKPWYSSSGSIVSPLYTPQSRRSPSIVLGLL